MISKDHLNQLKYFSLKKAIGGHANDGDSLIWKILFDNKNDLNLKLQKLSIEFPDAENDLQYAGYTQLYDEKIFLSIQNNNIQIEVFGANGDLYSVSEGDIEVCKRIETKIQNKF